MDNTNGCGACSGFWKFLKPPHHNFFKEDCDTHDEYYNKGGSSKDRLIADLILRYSMKISVRKHFYKRKWLSRKWYLFLAEFYYLSVRIFGKKQFNYK